MEIIVPWTIITQQWKFIVLHVNYHTLDHDMNAYKNITKGLGLGLGLENKGRSDGSKILAAFTHSA